MNRTDGVKQAYEGSYIYEQELRLFEKTLFELEKH